MILPFLRSAYRQQLIAALCDATATSDYWQALSTVQPAAMGRRSAGDGHAIQVVGHPWDTVDPHLREGLFEPAALGTAAPTAEEYRHSVPCINTGVDILRDSGDRGQLLFDHVDVVVVGHNPGAVSGSARHLLGAIVMCPPTDDTGLTAAGLLLHESVHQALWLAEMVVGLFAYSPGEIDALGIHALSPIRRQPRRIDSAFHAACVAVELASWHADAGRWHEVDALVRGLPLSVASLEDRRDAFTAQGRAFLEDLADATSALLGTARRG
jgi:hypothetical protein